MTIVIAIRKQASKESRVKTYARGAAKGLAGFGVGALAAGIHASGMNRGALRMSLEIAKNIPYLPTGAALTGALLEGRKTKKSSAGLEYAGLGMLAAPSVKHLVTGKGMSEKNKSRTEVAGLGTLAYGTYRAAKSAITKKAMAKTAAKLKSASDLWNPNTEYRSEEMHTRGSIAAKQQKPAAAPAPVLKPATGIRGTLSRGAPVTNAAPKPSMPVSSGFKPRMASLGKVTAQAAKPTGILGRAASFLGHR